jgi:hypothetical protein
MIPTSELAAMRAEINRLLPDTCQIVTITHTSDGAGGFTDTYGTASAIACRLDYMSGSEGVAENLSAGAVQPFGRYMLTLSSSAVILTENQVMHGGLTYNVMAVNTDSSWMGSKRAVLEVVRE